MNRTSVRAWMKVAVAAILLGCGGDGGTNPPPANPGFTLTPSGTTLSVEQGASASLSATIGRTGSFTGTVELSTENVPTGLTAVFSPSSITNAVTSASLTVTAALTITPGPYTFTVRGKANGLADQTFQATVTVSAKPAIAIALTPAAASVGQGGNSSYVANITRTNFTGAVTVAVTGAPTGVTTTVTPNGNAYTVAIGVATSTDPGTYQLVTTATGTGVANVSSSFALTVTAVAPSFSLSLAQTAITMAAGSSQNIALNIARINFTGAVNLAVTGAPTFFNTQLGDAAPTGNSTILTLIPLSGVAAGTHTLTVTGTATGLPTQTATIDVTVTPFVNVQLTATPDSLNFLQSGTVSTTITILRENFPDALTLTASGVPNGVTATFNASPTTANSAQLSFSAIATPVPGAYTITVTASATGISPRTTTLRLIVPGPMGISLSAAPTSLSIAQGAGSTTTITIARTGFTGAVNLAATAPPGVTVTFNPNNTTGNTSTATVSVSGSAMTGDGFITVTGSGTGISDAPLQIPLTVTTGSSGSGNITYTFCGDVEDIPVWLAVQNGSGAWSVVNGVNMGANKTFTFTITANGGVAWVTQENNGDAELSISYGVFSEFQGQTSSNCLPSSTTGKTLTGSVSGLGMTQLGSVSLGASSASPNFAQTNFTLMNVDQGPLDLIATRRNASAGGIVADKVIIRRLQNFANNAVIPSLNFDSEGEVPVGYTATVTGAPGGADVSATVTLTTPSTSALLSSASTSSTTVPFFALPGGSLNANDYHFLSGATIQTAGSVVSGRTTSFVFKGGANQTLALGPALSTVTASNLGGAPYARLRAQFAKQTEYTKLVVFNWSQGGVNAGAMTARSGTITATEAFIGSASTIDLSIPDFSALPGWLNSWAPVTGVSATYGVTAAGWTFSGGGFGNPLVEGTTIQSAIIAGLTLTP